MARFLVFLFLINVGTIAVFCRIADGQTMPKSLDNTKKLIADNIEPQKTLFKQIDTGTPFGNVTVLKLPELPKWRIRREQVLNNVSVNESSTETPLEKSSPAKIESYVLPIQEAGALHLVEIEYSYTADASLRWELYLDDKNKIHLTQPSETLMSSQKLLRSVERTAEFAAETYDKITAVHRLYFCPKNRHPAITLVNGREGSEKIQIQKVRLYQIGGVPVPQPLVQRPVLGYFYCHKDFDAFIKFISENGKTTYYFDINQQQQALSVLQLAGYNGAMIGVDMRNGSHSLLELENTPSLFDLHKMTFVPELNFASLLSLESVKTLLEKNPARYSEFYWDETPLPEPKQESHRERESYDERWIPPLPVLSNEIPPRDNIFHPLVQKAILEEIKKVLEKCAKHSSFGGLAIQLSPGSFTQLPLSLRSIDERTFNQFMNETKIEVPPLTGDWLARERAKFLQSDPKAWEAWVRWRTEKMQAFYEQAAEMVVKYRPGAKLYLSGGTMLDRADLEQYCEPSLSRRTSLYQTLRLLGFDVKKLNASPNIVFLRPSIVEFDTFSNDNSKNAAAYIYHEFDSVETNAYFLDKGMNKGTLFMRKETFVSPKEHIKRTGEQNRKRFVKQLAMSDTLFFVDGGTGIPLGEEAALEDFLAAFKKLPPVPFETYTPAQNTASLQPLTVRFLKTDKGLLVYLVNDAPFSITAKLSFNAADAVLSELCERRTTDPLKNGVCSVALLPYDFRAFFLDKRETVIRNVEVERPKAICGLGGVLEQRVNDFVQRVYAAQTGALALANPTEGRELQRLAMVAKERFQAGRISELQQILDGYWVQFLQKNVSLEHAEQLTNVPQKIAAVPNRAVADNAASRPVITQPESPTWMSRMKSWLPFGK